MRKYSIETIVGIFMVICLICIGYMTVKLGNVSFWGDDSYSLLATFNSVSGLRAGSSVEMLGIEIGRVAGLIIDQENQIAVTELRIQKGIKIFDDAIASSIEIEQPSLRDGKTTASIAGIISGISSLSPRKNAFESPSFAACFFSSFSIAQLPQ